jgi:putative flippase GtrA
LGLGQYAAQFVAHVLGVAFNYVTYSRHVFRDAGPAKARFLLSYVVNYGLSVMCLVAVSLFTASPYVAGLASIVLVSILNFFLLKHLVFIRQIDV